MRLGLEEIWGGHQGPDFFLKSLERGSCLCIGERSTASSRPQPQVVLPAPATHQNATRSAAQKARREPQAPAGGDRTAAPPFSVRRQQEGRKWEVPASRTRAHSGVLISTRAGRKGAPVRGGDRRPHAPRRLCGARRDAAREHAGERPLPAVRGQGRADAGGGLDPLPPGSVRPILGRSDWSSRRTTSPLPAALPPAAGDGPGGRRTPPPRSESPGFRALLTPADAFACPPSPQGQPHKAPRSGRRGRKVSLCLKRKGGRGGPLGSGTRTPSPPRI